MDDDNCPACRLRKKHRRRLYRLADAIYSIRMPKFRSYLDCGHAVPKDRWQGPGGTRVFCQKCRRVRLVHS